MILMILVKAELWDMQIFSFEKLSLNPKVIKSSACELPENVATVLQIMYDFKTRLFAV